MTRAKLKTADIRQRGGRFSRRWIEIEVEIIKREPPDQHGIEWLLVRELPSGRRRRVTARDIHADDP